MTLTQSVWQGNNNNTLNEQLTLEKLKAEIRWRAVAGVVDGLLVRVIPGVHISSKLYEKLNQANVFSFGCMMNGCLV